MTVESVSIVMLGVTGAFRGEVAKTLLNMPELGHLTLLGRRPLSDISSDADNVAEKVVQHKVDIFEPNLYLSLIAQHDVAICTLSVGQPSKMSKQDFLKVDKHAVLDFAAVCKKRV